MPSQNYLLSDETRTKYQKNIYGRKTITIAGLPYSGQKLAATTLQNYFVGVFAKDYDSVTNEYFYEIERVLRNPVWEQPELKTNFVLLDTMEIEKIFGFPPRVVGKWFTKWYEQMIGSYDKKVMKRTITEDLMKISKLIRFGKISYYAQDLDGQMVLYHPCCNEEFMAGKDTFKIWIDCDLDYCVWHASRSGYDFDRKFYSQNYIDKIMPMRKQADILVPNYDSKTKFTRRIIQLGKELHFETKPKFKEN